jgi:DNA-binding transcriptional ArsR family regulator
LVKLGDALKRAVETKPTKTAIDDRGRASSTLMNDNRRQVFKHLCLHPCSTVGETASALTISRATVNWHLKVLLEANYVEGHKVYGRYVFCPKQMIQSGKALTAYSLLRTRACSEVFTAVVERPGSDAKQLAKAAEHESVTVSLARLENVGLISSVRDGRHVRYFPTNHLGELILKQKKVVVAFQRALIQRLESEHLSPKVTEMRGGGLVIGLKIGDRADEIKIPSNPIAAPMVKN